MVNSITFPSCLLVCISVGMTDKHESPPTCVKYVNKFPPVFNIINYLIIYIFIVKITINIQSCDLIIKVILLILKLISCH